jgi:hypothetical protein
MSRFINLTGQKFGRLTVKERVENDKDGKAQWLCLCECGKQKIARRSNLRNGNTNSCGCLAKEILIKKSTKHGYRKGGLKSPTYTAWINMNQRCSNPNYQHYKNYGGRNKPIIVCSRWSNKNPRGFENFLKDMGERPDGYQIDRINNDLGYFKRNCRWTTPKINSRNKRNNRTLEYDNKQQCVAEIAEEHNIRDDTLTYRLDNGYSPEEALTIPVRKYDRKNK